MHTRNSILIVLISLALCIRAEAHAFLAHAEPAVGSKVKKAPSEVSIWFTEALEPAFCSMKVYDSSGKEIEKGKVNSDEKNPALLRVSLPLLKSGTYKVVWRAISVDTHVTNGDFTFQVVP